MRKGRIKYYFKNKKAVINDVGKLCDMNEQLEQELERYKNIIEIMERYFELIIDLSFDYDGLNEVKSLKVLIDELKNYASLGRAYNTTEPIYENNGKKYNILHEELKGE